MDPHQIESIILLRINAVSWIRIRIRIKVISWIRFRIRIKVISWIRILIILKMTSKNVWKMSLFEHFFKVLSLYLEVWIRIRNRTKEKVGFASGCASALKWQAGSASASK
jgi:hypothetical protein